MNMEENSSPQPTSKTSFDGNATNNRIPQKTEKVNRKSEKTDKSFALPEGLSHITNGMSDAERYEILKNKNITISSKTDSEKLNSVMKQFDITESDLDLSKYGDKKRLFKKLGEEFGVFRQYNNPDTKLTFSFSKGGMSESVSKQRKGYMHLAKLLTCIDGVIENAVGIEAHNRNDEGYKVDTSLKNVYALASAFVDGENIIPVKLEVKEFSDKKNTLYVAIALESIKKNEIVKQEVATSGVARQYSPSFIISIADFLRKINLSDESFYKYIPKQFFEADSESMNVSGVKYALPDNDVSHEVRETEKKRNFNYSEGQEAKRTANENAKKYFIFYPPSASRSFKSALFSMRDT